MGERLDDILKGLEDKGIRLYLVRNVKSGVDKEDKSLTQSIKSIMLEKLKQREVRAGKISLSCQEKEKSKVIDPNIAAKYIPFKDFLKMIQVSRKDFEDYIKNKKIKIKEEYLVGAGTYDFLEKPKIALPSNKVKNYLKKLYAGLEKVIFKPKKGNKNL